MNILSEDSLWRPGRGTRGTRIYPAEAMLTCRDILTELPFGNLTVMYEMTGTQLRRAFESGFSAAESESGRFPQVSGVRIEADLRRPPGERITSVLVGTEPLRDTGRYRVATNDYLARGRDGYVVLCEAKELVGKTDASMMASAVVAHIRHNQILSPKVKGRIVLSR